MAMFNNPKEKNITSDVKLYTPDIENIWKIDALSYSNTLIIKYEKIYYIFTNIMTL